MGKAMIVRSAIICFAIGLGMVAACANAQQKPSTDEARQVRERAEPLAKQGDANAQYNMGVLYDGGYGVDQNFETARNWYKKAATQDYSKAEHNLGVMYQEGRGVKADPKEAASWFKRAARHGESAAQNNLAVLYVRGQGVPQDLSRAAFWAARAADAGNPSAVNNLPRIVDELPRASIDGDNVNIRSKPSRGGRVVRQADQGTPVVILKTDSDWSQVLFPKEYAVGWVANFLVAKNSSTTDDASVPDDMPEKMSASNAETTQTARASSPSNSATDATAGAAADAAASQGSNMPMPKHIASAVVNIRERPTTQSGVRFQARRGETVRVIDRQNNWRRVRFDDGRVGWVAGFLITD